MLMHTCQEGVISNDQLTEEKEGWLCSQNTQLRYRCNIQFLQHHSIWKAAEREKLPNARALGSTPGHLLGVERKVAGGKNIQWLMGRDK